MTALVALTYYSASLELCTQILYQIYFARYSSICVGRKFSPNYENLPLPILTRVFTVPPGKSRSDFPVVVPG